MTMKIPGDGSPKSEKRYGQAVKSEASSADGGQARIRELLGAPRVLAVVGMSPKPERPSNYVSRYLREHGFTTIPVNPRVSQVDGLKAYPDLDALPEQAKIDIAVLFVAPKRTLPVVEQAARRGIKTIWFQPGAEHGPSEQRARELGLEVFSGMCMKATHERLHRL